jgi:hypothetical protein
MNTLDFKTAIDWLQQESGLKLSAQSGQVRLRDADQREVLMLESLEGGAKTALWAPIYHDLAPELAAQVGLHLLHLCADLDAMGPVKVARTPDAGRYLLVYASVQAADAAEFVIVCADLITMAKGIAGGLDDVSLELSDDAGASESASSLAVNGLTV